MFKQKTSNQLKQLVSWWYRQLILNQEKETGNILIVSIIMGLLVLGATSLSLFNSSKDQTRAQSEEYTKQAIATTEQGITRATSNLNDKYPYFLKLSYNPHANPAVNEWLNPPAGTGTSPCHPSTQQDLQAVTSENLGSNRSYNIKSYIYDNATQEGTLTLQGQSVNGSANSKAELVVGMKVQTYVPPNSFPGLYGETVINIGNNDILAETTGSDFNVVCTDCTSSLPTGCVNGEPSEAYLNDALGVSSNGDVEGNMVIGLPQLPEFPAPPANACSATQAYPCHIVINEFNNDQTFPRATDVTNRTTWIADGNSTAWTATGDLSQPYIYIIKRQNSGQQNSVYGGQITINTTTAPVRWYVSGNVKLSGASSYISHTGTLDRFAIFGCTDSFNSVMTSNSISPTCVNPYTAQEIKLNGQTAAVNVFVYAPNATVGVNGGGDFKAVIWANAWDMSNGNGASVTVPDQAQSLLSAQFGATYGEAGITSNRITNLTEWRRKEAN